MNKKQISPARMAWKHFYRLQRIAMREISKVMQDQWYYGVGFYQSGPDVPDFIRHVSAEDVFKGNKA